MSGILGHWPSLPDLTHTPGIYYGFAYWLYGSMFAALNRRKRVDAALIGKEVLGLLILCFFAVITDFRPRYLFIPLILCFFSLVFLFVYSISDLGGQEALFITIRAFFLGEFAAALEWQLYYYGLTRMNVPLNMTTNLIFVIGVHTVILIGSWFMENRFCGEVRDIRITKPVMAAVVMICILTYMLSNISFVFYNTPFSGDDPGDIFIIRTLADMIGVTALFACSVLGRNFNQQLQAESLQAALNLQYEQYRLTEEAVDLVNRKYHDLKHQIMFLRESVNDEEKTKYLAEMEEEIRQFEVLNKTGNHTLDTILTSKNVLCKKNQTTFHSVVDGEALDFLDPMDLSALFGNILDNAVEAARKVEKSEERLIRLAVSKQKMFVKITEENRYKGELRYYRGYPVTSKSDKGYHGYGVRSIEATVKKYDGSLKISAEDGWFRMNILLPIPLSEGVLLK